MAYKFIWPNLHWPFTFTNIIAPAREGTKRGTGIAGQHGRRARGLMTIASSSAVPLYFVSRK